MHRWDVFAHNFLRQMDISKSGWVNADYSLLINEVCSANHYEYVSQV